MKYYIEAIKTTVPKFKLDNAGLCEVVTAKASFMKRQVCDNCKTKIEKNTVALRWWLRPNPAKFHEKYFCQKCYHTIPDPPDSEELVKPYFFANKV